MAERKASVTLIANVDEYVAAMATVSDVRRMDVAAKFAERLSFTLIGSAATLLIVGVVTSLMS